MDKVRLCFLICFITINSYAQWPSLHGTEYYVAIPNHLNESYDSAFICTYDFEKWNGLPSSSGFIKVDVNGNQLWKKELNNENKILQINGFAQAEDGSVAFCGHTFKYDDLRDLYIMKLNTCMESIWCKIFRTTGIDDYADEIVYIPYDSSFILTEWTYSQTETIRLIKFNFEGEVMWNNVYSYATPEHGTVLPFRLSYCDYDTSVLLSGIVYVKQDSVYRIQPYWLKVKSDGDMMWERYIIPDSAFVSGFSSRQPVFPTGGEVIAPALSSEYNSSTLIRMNYLDGSFINLRTLYQPDSSLYGVLNSMILLNNNIYAGVQYFTTGYNGIGNSSLQKNDLDGNLIQETLLPFDFTAVTYNICSSKDNKILLSTSHTLDYEGYMLIKYNQDLEYDSIYTRPFNYDYLCEEAITSGTIQMNCDVITDTENLLFEKRPVLNIYPNPTSGYTVVTLPQFSREEKELNLFNQTSFNSNYIRNLNYEVYNLHGDRTEQGKWPDNSRELIFNTTEWISGIYFVRVIKENKLITTGKLIVK